MNQPNHYSDSAYNPEVCVFVSANAGAGKTSLLTNRVLSLLLHGVEPSKILCLTFTNAAAAEMSNRILQSLGKWVMADAQTLHNEVAKLTGGNPSPDLLAHARGLFASVLESPQGVNIQTIHGFCQSLLKRFPLEAGVSPHFSVMDSRSQQEALAEARLRLFNNAKNDDKTIGQALNNLAKTVSESSFHDLIYEIIGNKRKFMQLLQTYGSLDLIEYSLSKRFAVSANDNTAITYTNEQTVNFRKIADILLQSDKTTDLNTGIRLADWFARPEARGELLEGYVGAFLTQKSEARKTIFTKDALKDTDLIEELLAEQQRIVEFEERRKSAAILAHSVDMLRVAEALLAQYEAIKRSHALMDYDDLILTACNLLTKSGMSPWVLFKLDGGIDHILVDEAQDTSPEQWTIVAALTEEFFSGDGAKDDVSRSLFIVGDEKQSIFSFQGADVKQLAKMQNHFSESIKAVQKPVYNLSLDKSYRSANEILQAVDAVFANPKAREGVTFGDSEFRHILTRTQAKGLVELAPLIKTSDDESGASATSLLARHTAQTIAGWLERGEAKPQDIIILLRNRSTLADKLVRALKRLGVPVAGSDRMRLNDNLAVQDLIALGQILLLPDDDLTLAECLKSPIFNVSEDDLYALAYGRGSESLWKRLADFPKLSEAYELLTELRSKVDFISPFELYSHLLYSKGARANFIGRMGEETADPIDEFLQQTLLYERSHPPSMQGFLHWLASSNSEIKRDMEQAKDAVRIMTVHGAKGLQAKIVVLPDTVEIPREKGSILWLDDIAIRSISSADDNKTCRKIRAGNRSERLSEYRRLLYVALTRAEDRLYICGATSKDKISDESWYSLIESALGQMQLADNGLQMTDNEKEKIISTVPVISHLSSNLSFLKTHAPAEPSPNKPLVPSRFANDKPAIASPLASKNLYASGKFIHLLLQFLPKQEAEKRQQSARVIAQKFTTQLTPDIIDKAIENAVAIIENPEFAFLFASDALAEVPITGIVDLAGKPITVSGQIDRLYIGESEVWIVDFKSNQQPPTTAKNIPITYIRQLALYRLLLEKIYPDKTVCCGLLWTTTAKLDIIENKLLEELEF